MVTTAVGLITEPQQAEDILQAGDADLIALARAFLYNPRWGWHAAAALGGRVEGQPRLLALPAARGSERVRQGGGGHALVDCGRHHCGAIR